MSQDIFTYENRVSHQGEIASSEFAIVSIGAGSTRNALVQSLTVQYNQQIEEVTQVGDSQIYWMPGRPSGEVNITTLVGTGGFFQGWQAPCGLIGSASVGVQGGKCRFNGKGTLRFDGAVVQGVSVQISTQQQTISQSAIIKIASLEAS
jgi:hypothetical protein